MLIWRSQIKKKNAFKRKLINKDYGKVFDEAVSWSFSNKSARNLGVENSSLKKSKNR